MERDQVVRHRPYAATGRCGGRVRPHPWEVAALEDEPGALVCETCQTKFRPEYVAAYRLVWATPQHSPDGKQASWCLPLPEAEGLESVHVGW